MWIWLVIACNLEPEQHPKLLDRQHYELAMSQQGRQAISSCKEILEEDLKGECILFAAKNMAHRRQDSRALCDSAPTSAWQDACRFDVIDVLGMTGDQADKACSFVGDFQSRCMYHAILREEDILAKKFPEGKEQELMKAILNRMEKLGVDEVEEEPLYAILTARIIARRFEAAWRKNKSLLFSKDECGQASPKVCSNAYRIAIKQIGKGRKPSNCSAPISQKAVLSTGLPVWEAEFNALAQQAWKSICHINHGPKKPPDHSSSQRANQR